MKIEAGSNTSRSVYEGTAIGGKQISSDDKAVIVPTDTVSLSDAATRLATGLSDLAMAVAAMPVPAQPQAVVPHRKKPLTNPLSPMLDVDAFRLIRDKLRSQNLGLQAPDPQTKKQADASKDENKV